MRHANGIFVGVHPKTEEYAARLYCKQKDSVSVYEFTASTLDCVLRKLTNSPQYVTISMSPCYLMRRELLGVDGLLHDQGYANLSFEEFERALKSYRKHDNRLMSTGPDIGRELVKVLRWQDEMLEKNVVKHKDNKAKRQPGKK